MIKYESLGNEVGHNLVNVLKIAYCSRCPHVVKQCMGRWVDEPEMREVEFP